MADTDIPAPAQSPEQTVTPERARAALDKINSFLQRDVANYVSAYRPLPLPLRTKINTVQKQAADLSGSVDKKKLRNTVDNCNKIIQEFKDVAIAPVREMAALGVDTAQILQRGAMSGNAQLCSDGQLAAVVALGDARTGVRERAQQSDRERLWVKVAREEQGARRQLRGQLTTFNGTRSGKDSTTVERGGTYVHVIKNGSMYDVRIPTRDGQGEVVATVETEDEALGRAWQEAGRITDVSLNGIDKNRLQPTVRNEDQYGGDERAAKVAERARIRERLAELDEELGPESAPHSQLANRANLGGPVDTAAHGDAPAAVHTDAPAVHGHDAGHGGGHEAHGATEFDARALKKQHAHEAILRGFAQQSDLGVNPETMNALRKSELSANIERLRNRGLFKSIGSFVLRAAIPVLVAGTAAYFMAPALAAWAFNGVLGSGVSLFGVSLTGAQVATSVAGAMIGAPTGFVGRALDQWRSNRKYGVGTGFIHAFWPFSSYGGELGKTLLTGDMVRNKAASGSRIERAQAPLFKHYNALEAHRNNLFAKHALLTRKLGVAPAKLTAELKEAEKKVALERAYLSSYENVSKHRHPELGTLEDAQRSGENFSKWSRIIGTAILGASAGFSGGMVRSAVLDGLMSSTGGNGISTLANTTPAVGPRADVVPPPGTRVGGSVVAEVTGGATRASMESELAQAKAEIARLRATGVPVDQLTAANRRRLQLEDMLDARAGKAPTGAEMVERIKSPISGAEVVGRPRLENTAVYTIVCKTHGRFVAHTWDAVGAYLSEPGMHRSPEFRQALAFFEHGQLGSGRPRMDFVKDLFDASLDSGRATPWKFGNNDIVRFMSASTHNPQFVVGMDLNSMPNKMQFMPSRLFGNTEYMGRLAEKVMNMPPERFPGGAAYKQNILDVIAGLFDASRADITSHAAAKAALRIR